MSKIELLRQNRKYVVDLYLNNCKSLPKLCKKITNEFGIKMTVGNVGVFLKECGVLQSLKNAMQLRSKISDVDLIYMYVNKKMSINKIAQRLNISSGCLCIRLQKMKLLRSRNESAQMNAKIKIDI